MKYSRAFLRFLRTTVSSSTFPEHATKRASRARVEIVRAPSRACRREKPLHNMQGEVLARASASARADLVREPPGSRGFQNRSLRAQ
eukprot:9015174-Pyramimonas_sp.AAC.1